MKRVHPFCMHVPFRAFTLFIQSLPPYVCIAGTEAYDSMLTRSEQKRLDKEEKRAAKAAKKLSSKKSR